MITIKKFKIRASGAICIMASMGISEIMLGQLEKLQARKTASAKGEKDDKGKLIPALTPNMEMELADLIRRRDKPELPQGAKTYCDTWLREQIYGRQKEFTSKQTDKGNKQEKAAIDYVSEVLGWGFGIPKNTKHYSLEYFEGTPDVVLNAKGADTKVSWDCFTFPLDEEITLDYRYWWQNQVYMALTGKYIWETIYVLMSATEDFIDNEAKRKCWELYKSSEIPLELYNEIKDFYSYDDLPPALRVRVYPVAYNEPKMLELVERVKLCRQYIQTRVDQLNAKHPELQITII